MKKFASILTLLFYLLPAMGFTLTSHYCGGKLVAVSLADDKDAGCCGSSSAMAPGCCKTVVIKAELKDAGLKTALLTAETKRFVQQLYVSVSDASQVSAVHERTDPRVVHPRVRRVDICPLYLVNRILRI